MNGHAQTLPRAMVVAQPQKTPWGFAEWFAISQTALPAILILPGTQAVRLPIRISAFAVSLADATAAWRDALPTLLGHLQRTSGS